MINVTKTYLPKKEKYIKYIDKIFENNWLTNNGPLLCELQERLKKYLNVENLLLVSNGTLAIQIAARVMGLSGKVITTPFSFVATTSALVWEGIEPVYADIDKETLCMNPTEIEKKITPDCTGIVPVHVYGNCCDVEEIDRIAKENNLKVIYDAAHAFDVNYKNGNILNWGDASTISFHSTKLFHTIEGGAIVFKNKEDYEKAKLLINFGINGPDSIVELGINCKMNEFQAAMGLCVLDDIEQTKDKREELVNLYEDKLGGFSELKFVKYNSNGSRNYSYFPIIFNSERILLNVINALKEEDINPRRYFYPSLDTLTYLEKSDYMPNSNNISKRILCLPLYASMTLDEVTRICSIIEGAI